MKTFCHRLLPGSDLKGALDALFVENDWTAATVLSGIGSLCDAPIRFAGEEAPEVVPGPLEILSLGGTLSRDGSHLHLSVSDQRGKVTGGHLKEGAIVRTTVELVIAILPEWRFARIPDPETGSMELKVSRVAGEEAERGNSV